MDKTFVKLLFLMLLCACQHKHVKVMSPDPMTILENEKRFLIRSNPCGCIIDTPELAYEIKLGRQWKRAFLERESSDPENYTALQSVFLKTPLAVREVEAKFTGIFYQWLSGHNAPGIALETLIQPTNDAEKQATTKVLAPPKNTQD